MSFFLLIVLFIALSFFLIKWKWVRNSGIKKEIIVGLFGIKILAGFALVYLYATYYNKETSDIYIYFNDAMYLKHLFITDRSAFWNILFNQNLIIPEVYEKYTVLNYWASPNIDFIIHEKRFVILLNFLFSFISMDNIYIHSMLMAFFGFIGQIAIFRFVKKQSNINPIFILIVTFLLPTFLLWSSTILKEPLIIFSMGLLLFFIGKWTKKWNIKYLLTSIFFFLLGLFIKPYIILALTFPLLIFVLFKLKDKLHFKKQSLIVFTSSIAILLVLWLLSFTPINVFEKLSNKQAAFYDTIELAQQQGEVGSQIELDLLEGSLGSFILNTPKAFSNVMFRPSLYEFRNLLYLPDIFQNLLLLVITIFFLFKYKKPNAKELPFLWFSLLYIIILFTLIGLVTPVLGAIVRYKIPALIFVFFFLLSFLKIDSSLDKWKKYFFSVKKRKPLLS